MDVQIVVREFEFNGKDLTDPDNKMTPQQVLEHYSNVYPELAIAKVTGGELNDSGNLQYKFETILGDKG